MLLRLILALPIPLLVAFLREKKSADDDPCLDSGQVSDVSSIRFPRRYSNISRPWLNEGIHPKIFTSSALQYQWSWVESLPIRGLTPSTTIGDVVRLLDGLGCLFLATGPSVWQTVHKTKPISISGEASCPLTTLYSWCLEKFPATSCGLYPLEKEAGAGKYRLEIGDAKINASIEELRSEPLHLYEWGSSLAKGPAQWAYSLDGMAIYDNQAGQVYLIDLAGRGYTDTCEKKISPAIDPALWEKWATAPMDKILQFYQLRWQGFSTSSSEFEKFVNHLVEERFSKEAVQTFYCENLLGGVVNYAGPDITTTCHMVFPDDGHRTRISQAREILEHELGSFFKEQLEPATAEMEAVFLTQQQFVDVRNRLKKRISSPLPTPDQPHLVLGEPLVGDISEVHRRPILSKSEAITDLPPDFPSAPKATPDGEGGFKEGSDSSHDLLEAVKGGEEEPEGAGGGFQHETYGAGEDDEEPEEPAEEADGRQERREARDDAYGFPGTTGAFSAVPSFVSLFLLAFI